jgi:hypothetical protein
MPVLPTLPARHKFAAKPKWQRRSWPHRPQQPQQPRTFHTNLNVVLAVTQDPPPRTIHANLNMVLQVTEQPRTGTTHSNLHRVLERARQALEKIEAQEKIEAMRN